MISKFASVWSRQRGQSMVFVVLFLGVVCLSLVFLYKAGKVTSEKMQLQNAADAAAYSVAVTEARDLNFMAYTNRAMIANEVAIGQMVGMASWAKQYASAGNYLMAYHDVFIKPLTTAATLGIAGTDPPTGAGGADPASLAEASAGSDPIKKVFKFTSLGIFIIPGFVLQWIYSSVAAAGATVLHNINDAYSQAQTGYHLSSVLYAVSAYLDTIEHSAPNAKVSDFGVLALIGHAMTYGSIPGVPGRFTTTYKPTEAQFQEGYRRLAAAVNGSKDQFSRTRGWTLPMIYPLDVDSRLEIDLGIATLYIELEFVLKIELQKEGGSELRYKGSVAKGENFNWSAADTAELALTMKFRIKAGAEIDLGIFGSIDIYGEVLVGLGDGDAYAALSLPVIGEIFSFTIPFPTGAPFSAGAAQVDGGGDNYAYTSPAVNSLSLVDLWNVSTKSYGKSPTNRSSWLIGLPGIPVPFPPPLVPYVVPVVSMAMGFPLNRITNAYKGLPMYTDTNPVNDPWGFQAPYFLSGVVKKSEDRYSEHAPLKTSGVGGIDSSNFFYLDDAASADAEVGAISKSEVYFSRPADLSFFRRDDGRVEYGSAFNPYWQARLVETTNADRAVALRIQQKQSFGLGESEIEVNVPEDLSGWLPGTP